MTSTEIIELKNSDIINAAEARMLLSLDELLEKAKNDSNKTVCPDCKKPMTKERIEKGPNLNLSYRFVWVCGCTVNYK